MNSVDPGARFTNLAARLVAKARMLGQARGEILELESRKDPQRWRKADLLWPLFARN